MLVRVEGQLQFWGVSPHGAAISPGGESFIKLAVPPVFMSGCWNRDHWEVEVEMSEGGQCLLSSPGSKTAL